MRPLMSQTAPRGAWLWWAYVRWLILPHVSDSVPGRWAPDPCTRRRTLLTFAGGRGRCRETLLSRKPAARSSLDHPASPAGQLAVGRHCNCWPLLSTPTAA